MGSEPFATLAGYPTIDATETALGEGSVVNAYGTLGPLETAALHGAATLLLAVLVLGLVPSFGARTVDTARRSPIISTVVGAPTAAVLAVLLGIGYVLLDSSVGVFFGLPLVLLGTATLPAWIAVGFSAVGATVVRRVGVESRPAGAVAGAILSGGSMLVPPVGYSMVVIAAVLGTGAGVRTLLGGGGIGGRDERVVPPANKV